MTNSFWYIAKVVIWSFILMLAIHPIWATLVAATLMCCLEIWKEMDDVISNQAQDTFETVWVHASPLPFNKVFSIQKYVQPSEQNTVPCSYFHAKRRFETDHAGIELEWKRKSDVYYLIELVDKRHWDHENGWFQDKETETQN